MGGAFQGRIELQPLGGGPAQPYDLVAELGRGGMGVVYRARDPAGGREVAIKTVHRERTDPVQLQRFLREGEVTAALEHPGIVRIHGAGTVRGRLALVYELVEGARTLGEVLPESPPSRRLELVRDAALALGHAHAHGVVHRDVKPDNVLVDREGRVRVADFGLAGGEHLDRLTRSGATMGTLQYMSPEQFQGQRVGPTSDVWSLGVVLFEALVGHLPFRGETALEIAAQLSDGLRAPPSSSSGQVTPDLDAVCLRALALEPAQRYPDAQAFARDLDACLRGETPLAARSQASRWRLRLAALLGVAALGVGLSVAVVAFEAPAPTAASNAATPPRPDDAEPSPDPPAPAEPGPPKLGSGFELKLPGADRWCLAAAEDAVWIGAPEEFLRYRRRDVDQLAAAERIRAPGTIEFATSLGAAVWILTRDGANRWSVSTWAGDAWREVWRLPKPDELRGRLLVWSVDVETRLVVAQNQGAWLLRIDAAGALRQVTPLDYQAGWVRASVLLPGGERFALGGNGSTTLFGQAAVFDAESGELLWQVGVEGTIQGLAPVSGNALLAVIREQPHLLRVAAGESPAPWKRAQHQQGGRGLLTANGRICSLAWDEDARVAELYVWHSETGELLDSERIFRGGGGRLVWDPVWEGLWVVAPERAFWRPLRPEPR